MRYKRGFAAILLGAAACAALTPAVLAATPGTYYSPSGQTKGVVAEDGESMTLYFQDGRTLQVGRIGHLKGIPSFGDTGSFRMAGMDMLDIFFTENGVQSRISVSMPKPKAGEKTTYGAIAQWKLDLLNRQTLTPRTTGYKALDKAVAAKLAELVTDEMTNAQKLRAVYNYLIKQEYGVYLMDYQAVEKDRTNTSLLSYDSCAAALHLLEKGSGVCDNYSALFVAMANALGFEAYEMKGTINGSGHVWALLRMNGKDYIFDPQAEQENISGNHVGYVNFCNDPDYVTAYTPEQGYLAKQEKLRNV